MVIINKNKSFLVPYKSNANLLESDLLYLYIYQTSIISCHFFFCECMSHLLHFTTTIPLFFRFPVTFIIFLSHHFFFWNSQSYFFIYRNATLVLSLHYLDTWSSLCFYRSITLVLSCRFVYSSFNAYIEL